MFGGDRFEDLIGQISIGKSEIPSRRLSPCLALPRTPPLLCYDHEGDDPEDWLTF